MRPPEVLTPPQPGWGLAGLSPLPNETSAGTLPFAVAVAGGLVGTSVYMDTVTLGVWLKRMGAGMPCLLSQHCTILRDGHHLGTQRPVSRSCCIYSHSWQDPSHRRQKTAPPHIPSPGEKQPKSPYRAAYSSGEKCVYTFQMPQT